MGADWIIVGIAVFAVLLVLVAGLKSKLKKYKLVSPIKRVEPRKRRAKPVKKKRKAIMIRLI